MAYHFIANNKTHEIDALHLLFYLLEDQHTHIMRKTTFQSILDP